MAVAVDSVGYLGAALAVIFGHIVIARVGEHLAIAQILHGEQLTIRVGKAVVALLEVGCALLDAQQFAHFLLVHIVKGSQIEIALLVEEGRLLQQFTIGRTGHLVGLSVHEFLLHLHGRAIKHSHVEIVLIRSVLAFALLVVVEVEHAVVALTIGHDAAGGEVVPALSNGNVGGTLAKDAHVVGVQLCPDDVLLVAVGSHDEQRAVVHPGVGVVAAAELVLSEDLLLHHLHTVVLKLELGEAVGREGHLIVVLSLEDGLHGVGGVDLAALGHKVHHGPAIERINAVHDGSNLAGHAALLADGDGEVEVVGSDYLRLGFFLVVIVVVRARCQRGAAQHEGSKHSEIEA